VCVWAGVSLGVMCVLAGVSLGATCVVWRRVRVHTTWWRSTIARLQPACACDGMTLSARS
jgi:hypothetical protein